MLEKLLSKNIRDLYFGEKDLTETLVGNKYYLFSTDSLDDIPLRRWPSIRLGSSPENKVVDLYDQSRYNEYKKFISKSSASETYNNYIYKVTKSLKIFEPDRFHFEQLYKNDGINKDEFLSYWVLDKSISDEALIDFAVVALKEEGFKPSAFGVKLDIFKMLYDGFRLPKEDNISVFFDIFKANNKLIDGNVKRFGTDKNVDLPPIPNWVIADLAKYTNDPGKRLKKDTKEWLKNNFPKPYSKKTVYRGFGTQFDRDFTEKDILKKLKRRTGLIKLTDVKVGAKIKVKRGKASSWSTTPQISKEFTSGMIESSINFLVKTDIPSEKVVIDFTELPESFKKQFRFHAQNEVIVDTGTIDGIISELWVDASFNKWLNKNGYVFKDRKGIRKK